MTVRYRATVEWGYPDDCAPVDVFRELTNHLREVAGTVVSMERVDPVWCEDCETHHDGTGPIERVES